MLFQFDLMGYEWVLGLGIAFGLALFFNYMTFKDLRAFFLFLTIFTGFMVWAELLELWTLVVNVIISVSIIYFDIKTKQRSG